MDGGGGFSAARRLNSYVGKCFVVDCGGIREDQRVGERGCCTLTTTATI